MWLTGNNSAQRIEEMQRENLDKLNYEISKYYLRKRKEDRKIKAAQERRQTLEKIENEIRSETSANISTGKPLRHSSQLVFDGFLTTKQLLPKGGRDRRTQALTQVLCSIPATDYEALKRMFGDEKVLILIPSKKLGGSLTRIKKYKDCVLYLSPTLESYPDSYVRNIAAHEMAHIFLHGDFLANKKESQQEIEASLKAIEWGF